MGSGVSFSGINFQKRIKQLPLFEFSLSNSIMISFAKLYSEVIDAILTLNNAITCRPDNLAQLLIKRLVDQLVYFSAPLYRHLKEMIIYLLKKGLKSKTASAVPNCVIMKDLMKKMTLVVALLSLNFAAFAYDVEPDVRISAMADAKKFSLELANIEPGATTVSLYDSYGTALLTERVGKNTYGKVFNLANLPTGSYELVITTTNRDIVQPIELGFDGVEMDANRRTVYFAPAILTNKTNLDISYFRGKITDVDVAIYKNNDLIFQETFDHVIKVERRYDLSSMPKGKYNVMVTTDYKTYYQELVVE